MRDEKKVQVFLYISSWTLIFVKLEINSSCLFVYKNLRWIVKTIANSDGWNLDLLFGNPILRLQEKQNFRNDFLNELLIAHIYKWFFANNCFSRRNKPSKRPFLTDIFRWKSYDTLIGLFLRLLCENHHYWNASCNVLHITLWTPVDRNTYSSCSEIFLLTRCLYNLRSGCFFFPLTPKFFINLWARPETNHEQASKLYHEK